MEGFQECILGPLTQVQVSTSQNDVSSDEPTVITNTVSRRRACLWKSRRGDAPSVSQSRERGGLRHS